MNKTALGFQFIPENCVQCHACEVACKTWRNLENTVKCRRVTGRFEGQYPDTRLISVSVSCLHCNTPACVEVCPANAITKREEDGVVLVDTASCVGCRECLTVCPVDAPQFGFDGTMQKCDMCADSIKPGEGEPPCVSVCPTRAILRRNMPFEEKASLDGELISLLYGK